jgi:hypothetical protein
LKGRGKRLVKNTVEVRVERRLLPFPGFHLGAVVGMFGKPRLDLGVPHLIQFAIHIGMQFGVAE